VVAVAGVPRTLLLFAACWWLLLVGCGSSRRAAPQEGEPSAATATEATEPTEAPTQAPTQTETAPLIEFVTGAQLNAPDESQIVGVAISMRGEPEGNARDFAPTEPEETQEGDGRAVLFGAEMIRDDDGSILSARTAHVPRRFTLERRHLPGPVRVWLFDDADITAVERLEPCMDCEPWRSPEVRFIVVVPETTAGDAHDVATDWNIAIDP
jgi:hypothetical protein